MRDKYLREKIGTQATETEPEEIPHTMHGTLEKEPEIEEIPVLDQMGLKIKEWVHIDIKDPLDKIRAGKRGIGNHALTIFRTESTKPPVRMG